MKLDIFFAEYIQANLVKLILAEPIAQEFLEAVEVMLGPLMAEFLGDPRFELLGVDTTEFLTRLHLGSAPLITQSTTETQPLKQPPKLNQTATPRANPRRRTPSVFTNLRQTPDK